MRVQYNHFNEVQLLFLLLFGFLLIPGISLIKILFSLKTKLGNHEQKNARGFYFLYQNYFDYDHEFNTQNKF